MKRIAIIALVALTGCATTREPYPPAPVHHVILCWLKEPGNAAHRQMIIKRSQSFKKIPGVRSLRAGEALVSDREIVDDSFDVAIIMSFDDVAAMERYVNHSAHKKIVQEGFMPVLSKIVIYDFKE